MRTGQWVGIRFTYSDGSEMLSGSWKVPHDTEIMKLEACGSDMGWTIFHHLARQDPLGVAIRQGQGGTMIFVLMLTTACGPKVIRDAETFKVETLAAEKRQTEAAAALFDAAERARVSGDRLLCAEYAIPALLIEAFAVAQSRRALYLAGLLDEDPGPSPEPRDVNDVCGEN